MYRKAQFALSVLTGTLLSAVPPRTLANQRQPEPYGKTGAEAVGQAHLPFGSRLSAGTTEQNVRDAYGKLPLAFVPNAGQTDARVRFSAEAGRAAFYFTQKEAVFAFRKESPGEAGGVVLRLAFLGANPGTAIEGQGLGTGKVNYLIGNDRSEWRTGLPTYGQVVYRDLWPGVDMVFRGDAARLKYEFVLRPGAKVEDIHLAYHGAEGLSVDRAGQLLIATALGTLKDERPLSYQEIEGRRVPVASRFLLRPAARQATTYGFAVGGYDATQPLVIDPGLVYSTYLGGGSTDIGNPIAVDATGNAYITGETNSTAATFPETVGAYDIVKSGGRDAFVAKLNATGSALVYATYLGGSSDDIGFGIAVDGSGNAYVTGETASRSTDSDPSNNFPTTLGAYDTVKTDGGIDAFVTKLNPTGSALVYSTFLGGINEDRGRSIAVDALGNGYVTGETKSGGTTPFPTTLGAFDTSQNGASNFDAFVTKLNPAGSALVYSTFLGASGTDQGFGIAVDSAGNAYVTGQTNDSTFPTTIGAFDTSKGSGFDVFVSKLNPAGTALVYSTFLGGNNDDLGFGIAVDSAGSAYVTGQTQSSDFPTTAGAFDSTNSQTDAFVTKLNATGTAPLLYSTFFGGSSADVGHAIAVDSVGNVYVTGETQSSNFPTTTGALDTSYNGNVDAFVAKLNPTLSGAASLVYSTYLGGSNADVGHGIVVTAPDTVYVAGETQSGGTTPFPTTTGAFDTSYNGSNDAFVTKLDTSPSVGECTGQPDGSACTADTNDCTNDVCQAGVCTHPNKTAGATCGSSANTDCDNPDTCNGSGVCQANNEANGFACTSDAIECTLDSCLAGLCTHPPAPMGTACGSSANTDCDNPDTCNGAGSCQANNEANGFACTADTNECTNDVCSGGACTHPNKSPGAICGSPTTGECDAADTCNGSGVCQSNNISGSCTPDTNDCTNDVCSGGACTHPNKSPGAICGSPTTGECDAADTCNGSGVCQPNNAMNGTACTEDGNVCTSDSCLAGLCTHPPQPLGTACGSQSNTDCDNPNTCDGAGSCQPNNELNGTPCVDADVCSSPDSCQGGVCTPGPVVGGCKVTGGGQLTTGGDKVSFGLNAQTTTTGSESYKGQVEYNNHTDGTAYHSVSITSLVITPATSCPLYGKKATFGGQIRKKGDPNPYSYTLVVEDCGEPGRDDTFYMSISDGESRGPQKLDKGNIQVH